MHQNHATIATIMATVVCVIKACACQNRKPTIERAFVELCHNKSFLSFATEHFPGPHGESDNVVTELACNESGPWTIADKSMVAGGVVVSFNIKYVRLSCDGQRSSSNEAGDLKPSALQVLMNSAQSKVPPPLKVKR